MCVDKSTMKCCGSCSLTVATIVLGVLYALGALGSIGSRQYYNMGIMIVCCVLFIMVCVKKHDVTVRKILFILITILQTLSLLGLIVTFIYLLTVDEWLEETCYTQIYEERNYDTYDECKDAVNLFIYIAFGTALVIQLLFCWCEIQILYYGWKEQENIKAGKNGDGSEKQMQQQQLPA